MNPGVFLLILAVIAGIIGFAWYGACRVQRFEDELERVFWERERRALDVVDRLPETEAK